MGYRNKLGFTLRGSVLCLACKQEPGGKYGEWITTKTARTHKTYGVRFKLVSSSLPIPRFDKHISARMRSSHQSTLHSEIQVWSEPNLIRLIPSTFDMDPSNSQLLHFKLCLMVCFFKVISKSRNGSRPGKLQGTIATHSQNARYWREDSFGVATLMFCVSRIRDRYCIIIG